MGCRVRDGRVVTCVVTYVAMEGLQAKGGVVTLAGLRVGTCSDVGMRHVNHAPARRRWCDLGSRDRPLPGWAHRSGTLPSRAGCRTPLRWSLLML